MTDFSPGGYIRQPIEAPDGLITTREQVIFPDGSVRCVYVVEPYWDGSVHPGLAYAGED